MFTITIIIVVIVTIIIGVIGIIIALLVIVTIVITAIIIITCIISSIIVVFIHLIPRSLGLSDLAAGGDGQGWHAQRLQRGLAAVRGAPLDQMAAALSAETADELALRHLLDIYSDF